MKDSSNLSVQNPNDATDYSNARKLGALVPFPKKWGYIYHSCHPNSATPAQTTKTSSVNLLTVCL